MIGGIDLSKNLMNQLSLTGIPAIKNNIIIIVKLILISESDVGETHTDADTQRNVTTTGFPPPPPRVARSGPNVREGAYAREKGMKGKQRLPGLKRKALPRKHQGGGGGRGGLDYVGGGTSLHRSAGSGVGGRW